MKRPTFIAKSGKKILFYVRQKFGRIDFRSTNDWKGFDSEKKKTFSTSPQIIPHHNFQGIFLFKRKGKGLQMRVNVRQKYFHTPLIAAGCPSP
jgi:hypothetical protein